MKNSFQNLAIGKNVKLILGLEKKDLSVYNCFCSIEYYYVELNDYLQTG